MYLFLRLELVFAVFLPVFCSILLTLGTLGLLGIPVSLVNTLFIVFILGVGIDYSVFLLNGAVDAYRGKEKHEEITCGAIVVCTLATLCAFVTLAVARHPVLRSIGVTGSVGSISSLAVAVLVVPATVRLLLPYEGRYGTLSLRFLARGSWAFVFLVGHGLVYLCLLRYLVWLRYPKNVAARQSFARKYIHKAAAGLMRYFPYSGSELTFIGSNPESFRPSAVIVSNHLSPFDIMVILALPAEMIMVVKRWVWDAPVMGRMVRDAGYLLAQETEAETLLARCSELLQQGVSVMIFPEGTRSPDGRMRRFHRGAFELAIRTDSDVIPVLLTNTQSCIPRNGFWVGDFRSIARVLPRVTKGTFDYAQGSRALSKHVKEKMSALEFDDWRTSQNGKAFWHNIRSLYNYSGKYIESYIAWKLRLDPIYRQIDEIIPDEGPVLDLGCGYGLMSNILGRKSFRRHVLGVDFDRRKVGVAQRTAVASLNVFFELHDINEWNYPAADAVVMVDVVHYWPEDQQRSIMQKACACVRQGGTLVFRDALASAGWRHRLTVWGEYFSTRTGHNQRGNGLHFCERDFYVREFENAGMKLYSELSHMGRGSNSVLVFRKDLL